MEHGDGNDYQLFARFVIFGSIVTLIVDRIFYDGDPLLFIMAIFFLFVSLFLIPTAPQPPSDQ